MAPDDALLLDNQLCFALYAASRAMVAAYQPLLARLGVTYPQYLVLLVLWERDGASVRELGERLQLDSGTLTPLLKRMEAAGLVSRARAAHDERVVQVTLTVKGRRLKERAREVPAALACRVGLDVKELGRLRGELKALVSRLQGDPTEEKARRR
jgi:DNA-binding MarR family transcriptional regulator